MALEAFLGGKDVVTLLLSGFGKETWHIAAHHATAPPDSEACLAPPLGPTGNLELLTPA